MSRLSEARCLGLEIGNPCLELRRAMMTRPRTARAPVRVERADPITNPDIGLLSRLIGSGQPWTRMTPWAFPIGTLSTLARLTRARYSSYALMPLPRASSSPEAAVAESSLMKSALAFEPPSTQVSWPVR
jgi:hypothetical protein